MSVNEVSNEAQRPYFGKGDLVSRTSSFLRKLRLERCPVVMANDRGLEHPPGTTSFHSGRSLKGLGLRPSQQSLMRADFRHNKGIKRKDTKLSRVFSFGSPCWARTSDNLINSQVLYRLS